LNRKGIGYPKFLVKAGFIHAKAYATAAMLRTRLKILSIKGKAIPLHTYYMPISSHEVVSSRFVAVGRGR
jgi:hypothetical protein